jgi:hypothetical protein
MNFCIETWTPIIFVFFNSNFSKNDDNYCSFIYLGRNSITRAFDSPWIILATRAKTLGVCEMRMKSFSNSFISLFGTLTLRASSIILNLTASLSYSFLILPPCFLIKFEKTRNNNNLIVYLLNIKSLYNLLL